MNGFNQEPITTQGFARWKNSIIVIGVAVLLILIIVGAWWFIKNQPEHNQQAVEISGILQELDKSLTACDNIDNAGICRSDLVEDAALQAGLVEICEELSGDDLETCVWKVSRNNLNADDCDLISDKDKRIECQDSIYRILALQDLDLAWCEKISGEVTRTRCVTTLTEKIAAEKGCSGTGIDQSVCDHQQILETAVASNDPDRCSALPDLQDQSACFELMGSGDKDEDGLDANLEAALGTSDESLDSDNDGLSDFEEYYTYRTNPILTDTDSDGYSDDDEVRNGYNPNGEGKL